MFLPSIAAVAIVVMRLYGYGDRLGNYHMQER